VPHHLPHNDHDIFGQVI